jgi:hypothetical protein
MYNAGMPTVLLMVLVLLGWVGGALLALGLCAMSARGDSALQPVPVEAAEEPVAAQMAA